MAFAPPQVFISTSSETWLEDIQGVVFARARKVAKEMRMAAAKSGVAELTMDDSAATSIMRIRVR